MHQLTLSFSSECSKRNLVSQRKLVIIQSNVQLSCGSVMFQQFVTQGPVPAKAFRLRTHCLINW